MKKYWDVVSEIENIDYCMDTVSQKGALSCTDSKHPIFDDNEVEYVEAPRILHRQHWDQIDVFDTFPLRGQNEDI
jgi:hypothetical protein